MRTLYFVITLIFSCSRSIIYTLKQTKDKGELDMYVEKVLETITASISSKELLDKIIKEYLQEMKNVELEDSQSQYPKNKRILDSILTDKQKENLVRIEKLFAENMQYNIGFGFKKGLYTGFEQFFVDESVKEPFNLFVHDEILTLPNMKKYKKYYDRLNEINQLFEDLTEKLEEDNRKCVTIIYSLCDEKSYNILRYSFYLGYRYALSIIGDIKPLDIGKIINKILCTEHQLAFTLTYEERERQKYMSDENNKSNTSTQ